jgi:7-keto-8-aminopelargonate synthetase-like enzyme
LGQLRPGETPASAIVPWIIGNEQEAMQMSADLHEAGFLIPAIRYPTVARGTARLRVTLSADHTEEQVGKLLTAFGQAGLRGVSGER